jgi:hypothetical protein
VGCIVLGLMGRRCARAGFGGLLAGLFAAVLLAVSAPAAPGAPLCSGGSCTVTFAETGAAQTWTVPAGVTSATFTVEGAAGGNGVLIGGGTAALGGLGAEVQATLGLGSGTAVTFLVGGAGVSSDGNGVAGFNGGGAGSGDGGGGGGGFSSVAFGSTVELLAGGGGGGGGYGVPFETVLGGAGGAGGGAGSAGAAGDSASDGQTLGGGGGGHAGGAGGTGGSAGALGGGASSCPGPPAPVAGTSGSLASGSTGGAGAPSPPGTISLSAGGGGGGGEAGGGGGGSGAGDSCSASGAGGGGGGGSSYAAPGAVATFTPAVQPGNGQVTITYSDPITAASKSYTAAAGQTLTVPAPGLLSGASGPSGDALTAQVGSTPAHGTATASASGSFAYTPASGFTGADSFQYEALDSAGDYATGTVTVTVEARPQSSAPPAIAGTAKVGATLVCSPGTWTNAPTAYSYQWSRDGTPISGATGSSYTVQAIDEGNTLSCAVAAVNVAGAGSPVASAGVLVPVPYVARCPAATGKLSGTRLGPVKLGMTKAQARRAFTHSSSRGKRYQDFFCLTPIGIRVGYASPKSVKILPANSRGKLAGRVIWISTSSAFYAVKGIRPGATIAAGSKALKVGKVFRIGLNDWYFAPAGSATAILKVRHGLVEEIGLAEQQLTKSRTAQRTFLTSFS